MRKLFTATLMIAGSSFAVHAAPEAILRPVERPQPRLVTKALEAALEPVGSYNIASTNVLRPVNRPNNLTSTDISEAEPRNLKFQIWINDFSDRARRKGISDATLGRAFDGVSYAPKVIARDRNQSEFTKSIWNYLDSAVSITRIENGQIALKQQASALKEIEQRYGVESEVIAAIWGMESNYGNHRGDMDVVQSLATLAFDGRRGTFFEAQLIAALKVLDAGDIDPRKMTGSWAGAMGHTQFIPTSYLEYAVDFTGDGKRDIWSDDPTDALASTAAYLKRHGWITGQPWGVEVQLPANFDYAQSSRKIRKLPADWARLGVTTMDGMPVPNHGKGSILLPAGAKGAAFLVFKNFAVIERYNAADAYVIGVGHLSDRLTGAPEIQAEWPRQDRALSFAERQEMQGALTRAGFNTRGVDGRIGPNSIAALRAFQRANGLVPDGHPSLELLLHLR